MTNDAGGLAAIVVRFVLFAATTLAIGSWVFARLVLARLTGDTSLARRDSVARRAWELGALGAGTVALVAVPRLLQQGLAIASPDDAMPPILLDVLRSHWGRMLIVQAIAAGVLFVGMRRAARDGNTRLADLSVPVLAVMPALMGHAWADPQRAMLSVLVDVVHVATAGGWIGGLIVLTVMARVHQSQSDINVLLAEWFAAFHPVALASALTVFTTGLATAWLRMGAAEGIATGTYSGLFVVKVLLVFATGFVGASHAKLGKKKVASLDAAAMQRSLLLETAFAVFVLAVTAILVATPPTA